MLRSPQTNGNSFQKFSRNLDLIGDFIFVKCVDYDEAASWGSPEHKQVVYGIGYWEDDRGSHLHSGLPAIKKHHL